MKSNENCHTYVANVLLLLTMLPPWVLMTTGFSFWWHTTFTSHHHPSVKWEVEIGWMFCVCAFVSKKALLRPSAIKNPFWLKVWCGLDVLCSRVWGKSGTAETWKRRVFHCWFLPILSQFSPFMAITNQCSEDFSAVDYVKNKRK